MSKKRFVRLLAMLLVLIQMIGLLAGCGENAAEDNNEARTQTADPAESAVLPAEGDTAVNGYYEVKFALPTFATTQETEYTTLPDTVMVAAGTPIGALETPDRISSVFLGWSYDESGMAPAEADDIIDRNMTLYPRFALQDGMDDTGSLTYVSKRDVPADFAYELVSYGLTEEEVRDLLSLEDASLTLEDLPFALESSVLTADESWLRGIGLDEAGAAAVWQLVQKEQEDPAFDLTLALTELSYDRGYEPNAGTVDASALDTVKIEQIVKRYAPEELDAPYAPEENIGVDGEPIVGEKPVHEELDVSGLDEESRAVLAQLDVDLATADEAEIKAAFGLAEDDSLERFLREDVGLTVEQVLELEDLLFNREPVGDHWLLRPEGGYWEGGDLYSVAIRDTSKLRFIYEGEEADPAVVEYNITVHQDEVINISIAPQVNYVDAAQVQGVEFLGLLDLQTDENGDFVATENYNAGVMTYAGSDALSAGDVLAVHDGAVDDRGFTDGNVTYVKITEDLGGGQYAYEHAGLEDILFLADNIPVPDDGSLSDGTITLGAAALNFADPVFAEYGLDADSVMEPGDYLTFYRGTPGGRDYTVTGYGLITGIEEADSGCTVSYELTSEDVVMDDELLLYMQMPEAEIELTEEQSDALNARMEQQVKESGLVEETSDFLTGLILGEDIDFDSLEHGEELRNMTIQTEDGEITLDQLRQLADGGTVEVSDPHVTFLCGINLQHFAGKKGVRAEVAVSFTITISIADAGKLEIQPAVVLEQEFLLTPNVKVVRHKNNLGLTSSLDITASLEAGTYSGFGVCVTAQTKNNPNPNADKDWEEMVGDYLYNGDNDSLEARTKAAKLLITGGNKLIDQANKQKSKGQGQGADIDFGDGGDKSGKDSKQDYVSPGVGGDLPTKYSNMLSNDAKYINLVNQDLGSADFPIDPMGIIHCGIKINFVVAMKINAMIGAGLTYENAKMYSYCFRAKIWGGGDEGSLISGSSVKDIAAPNFRVDFYAFGMVGLRIGVSIDLRVGVFSTDLDSVGVVATAGVYAELYGFLYCWYEWTSGQGSTSGAMGSLLFEVGIYTDISVKVQVGMGKASKSWSLYATKTPLLQLGCVKYPIDYVIEPNDAKLDLTIPDGENTVKVPDELYKINLMALSTGKLSAESMDSRDVCETDARTYTASIVSGLNGADSGGLTLSTSRTWTQYNEDHFVVECFDLDSSHGKVKTGPSSFQYLPGTNEIFVNPIDTTASELWGKVVFTYKNTAFGFSTQPLQRTVYVHWTGTQQTAMVEYYLQDNSTAESNISGYTWTKVGTGSVSGYDGIRCYVDVTPELVNKYPGYQFIGMKLPDEAELREKYEAAEKEWKGASNAMRTAAYTMSRDSAEYKAADARYRQAKAAFDLCYDLYARYYDNNQEVFRNLSGTTWFTMRGATTVIRVYFKKLDIPSAWMIVREGSAASVAYDGRTIVKGIPIMDQMPEAMRTYRDELYDLNWYVYTFGGSYLTHATNWAALDASRGNLQWFTPLTEDMLPPEADNVVMVGLLTPIEFTVHWMNDDEEFTTTKVRHGDRIVLPEETPVQKGYSFYFWTLEDGTWVTSSNNTVMPARDVYIYATFTGQPNKVTWITDDGQETYSWVRTGVPLYDNVPESIQRDGYTLIWREDQYDYGTELPLDYAMPYRNMTVYGRYSLGFANITWVGDSTFTTAVEIGTAPTRPVLAERDEPDLAWMLDDGTVMQDDFVMPAHDVTATAYWHRHEWVTDESSVVPATCSTTGTAGQTCTLCGLVGGETLPIDPNNHNWLDYVVSDATCSAEGVMGHRCLWCGAEETSVIEIDPENHVITSLHNEKQETCGEEGYTGDLVCDDCGAVLEVGQVIPATGEHTSGGIFAHQDSTCTTQGYDGHYCFNCDQLVVHAVLPIDPDNHTWSEEYEVILEPTCGDEGTKRYTCVECGAQIDRPIPATGEHTWDYNNDTVVTPGTCSAGGVTLIPCEVCGQTMEWPLRLDPDNHTALGEPEIITAPTCFRDGEQRRLCADCGSYVFETIPALGHDWAEITYDWAEDNLHVTASQRCLRDSDHDNTETVRTDAEVVKAPTCTETGETVYTTRAFEYYPEVFEQQTKTVKTPALGHAWGEPTYTWSEDLGSVTATRVCGNDAAHIETETANTTSAVTKEPTVYEKGETTYTAVFENKAFGTQTKTVADIDSVDPDWNAATFQWAEDLSTVTATRTSRADPALVETETVETTAKQTKDPSCEEAGETVYTAEFENEAFGTQTRTVSIDPLGHDWQLSETVDPAPVFEHDDEYDFDYCTGWTVGSMSYVCSHDNSHTYSESIRVPLALASYVGDWGTLSGSALVIDLSKPLEDNEITLEEFFEEATVGDLLDWWVNVVPYTAANQGWWLEDFEDEELASALRQYSLEGDIVFDDPAQKDIIIVDYTVAALTVKLSYAPLETETFETLEGITVTFLWPDSTGHVHIPGEAVRENEVPATCAAEGSYDEVIYCTECHEELSRTGKTIEKLAHTPGTAVRENEVPATCTAAGSYDEVVYCTVCGEELSRTAKTIEKLAHTPGEAVRENEVPATCAAAGSYDEVVYCTVCGEELSREAKTIEKLAHTPGEAVRENEVPATCAAEGSYDEVVYCTVCGEELSRTAKTIEKIAHTPGEAVRENEISATCTAAGSYDEVVYCTVCGEELSRTAKTIEKLAHTPGEAVRENEVAATCTAEGSYDEVIYCTVCGEELSRATITTDALGHIWNEPTYSYDEDEGTVTARRTCSRADHPETETVPVSRTVTTDATCTEAGEATLTASFTNEAFSWSDTQTIPAKGHSPADEAEVENSVEPTCTEDGSYDEVVYCSVCGEELSRETMTIDALGHDYEAVVTAPTCTEQGYTTYTCSRCGDSYVDDYTDALGHAWGEPEWTWMGYTAATAAFTCGNDTSHTMTLEAAITSIRTEPTTEAEGSVVYTAMVLFADTEYTDSKTELLPKLGAPKLGSETLTDTGAPAVEMFILRDFARDGEGSSTLGELDPANDLMLWAYIGESAEDEEREDIDATLTWGEDYSGVLLEEIATGSTFIVHIEPTDTSAYAASDATLIVIHSEHEPADAVIENEVDAACTEDGSYDEVVYCSVCGEELSRETKTIDALGHDYEAVVTAPTCTEQGFTTYTCSRCGDSYVDGYTDALGHDWGDWITTTPATCTEVGEKARECQVCHAKETEELPALGHDLIHHEGQTATCTESGWEAYDTCTRCDYTTYVALPATGHTAGEAVIENKVDSTCTDDGSYDTVVYCAVCGEELSRETVTTDALGHAWGEPEWTWTGHTAATATFTCGNDESHVTTLEAAITENETGYTATVTLDGTNYEDTVSKIVPKLGTEFTTSAGAPGFEISLLSVVVEGAELSMETARLSDLDPSNDMWLWAYIGSGLYAEDREDIDATLTWAEDYSSVAVGDIQTGDTFKVRIAPADTAEYAVCTVTLTLVHNHDYQLTETKPAPILQQDEYGYDYCVGWIAGSVKTYTCDGCGDSYTEPGDKVSTAIYNMVGEYGTVSGSRITIDLAAIAEDNDITLEEYFEATSFGTDVTVDELIKQWVSVVPYTEDYEGWWLDDYADQDTASALRQFHLRDYEDDYAYSDPSLKNYRVLDCSDETLSVQLTFVPNDTDTYESLTFTVTFKFPEIAVAPMSAPTSLFAPPAETVVPEEDLPSDTYADTAEPADVTEPPAEPEDTAGQPPEGEED